MCERTIVVDNGSGSIYAGFAEEEDPISTFQNFTRIKKAGDRQTQYGDSCGDFSDAVKYRNFVDEITNGNVKINYPMERGIVVDWDGMEAVWSHTFSKVLNAKPEECNLLITEATMNPKPNREKMAQTLFEKFGFPAISIEQAGILPLYSAGLTTGVVLDCGDGVVETVPVWGGAHLFLTHNQLSIYIIKHILQFILISWSACLVVIIIIIYCIISKRKPLTNV